MITADMSEAVVTSIAEITTVVETGGNLSIFICSFLLKASFSTTLY